MRKWVRTGIAAALSVALGGCMSVGDDGRDLLPESTSLAYFPKTTQTQSLLKQLPAPQRQVAVAVYGFSDQTGQFKPTTAGQTLSRAVTQGAGSILVKALQDAGDRQWFTVVERERLDNLLKERQIIGEMRKRYLGEQQIDPNALPALLFAGVLLEGGSSVMTPTLSLAGLALLSSGSAVVPSIARILLRFIFARFRCEPEKC